MYCIYKIFPNFNEVNPWAFHQVRKTTRQAAKVTTVTMLPRVAASECESTESTADQAGTFKASTVTH